MSDKKPAEDKAKKNIKVLVPFRLKGKGLAKDQIVAKSEFANKADWQNLCHMEPARAEATNDAVGAPKAKKAAPKGKGKSGDDGAKTGGGMPGT